MSRPNAPIYTAHETAVLIEAHAANIPLSVVAGALGRKPEAVAAKLRRMGLVRSDLTPRPHFDTEMVRRRYGDLRFKLAMLAAIKKGAEKAFIGVVQSRSAHYIRRVHPPSMTDYRSSAAMAIDIGG